MKSANSRIASVILMILVLLVFGVYRLGWFDVSFVVRPSAKEPSETEAVSDKEPETETETEAEAETETETDTDTETEPDTETVFDTEKTEDTEPVDVTDEGFISYEDAKGDYERSYGDWEPGGEWILAKADVTLPDYFSKTRIKKYKVTYEMQEDRSPYKPVYVGYNTDKTSVTLYMGYIITETDKEDTVNIYTSEGKLIGSYNEKKITPAFCRDDLDRPLFIYKDAYYYLDEKKGDFIEADYIPDRDLRGANFDYTPDYGDDGDGRKFAVAPEVIDVYEPIPKKFDEEGFQLAYKIPTQIYKYTLTDNKGNVLSDSVFRGAYAFSGSRAAVVDEEGHLYYITKSGSVAVTLSLDEAFSISTWSRSRTAKSP